MSIEAICEELAKRTIQPKAIRVGCQIWNEFANTGRITMTPLKYKGVVSFEHPHLDSKILIDYDPSLEDCEYQFID
jgi:hypothetical protein